MRTVSLALVLLFAATAHAVPLMLHQQGRLLDAANQPLTGPQTVVFSLWDEETTGNLLWTETIPVTFDDGYFSVVLGDTNPIDENALDEPEVFLGLTIGDEELLPRQRVVSAPYAIMAGTAENVVGGSVDATSISVDGNPVVDGTGAWVGDPPPDTLSGLTCNTGDVPQKTGGGWVCVPASTFATTSLDWTAIDNRPAGLDDGDDVGSGDITDVITGPDSGLQGGTAAGQADLALMTCASSEILESTGSGWTCGYDDNDTYSAGSGEILTGTTFSVDPMVLDDGSNLIPDSFFSYGMEYWRLATGLGSVVTVSDGIGGNRAFTNDMNQIAWIYSDAVIPVEPNSSYEIGGHFRRGPGGSAGRLFLAVRLYDADMVNIVGDGTWWYYPVSGVELNDSNWHSYRFTFGAGTARSFPATARFMTAGAILNEDLGVAGNRRYQVSGLGIYREATRVYRAQVATGAITTGATLPGAITFYATEGQRVTLMLNYSGRPNAEGFTYLNLSLDGVLLGSQGEWSPQTWRRSFSAAYHSTVSSTGNHTFTGVFECGSGTTSFSDAGTEWPRGGLAWTVIVGG